MDRDHLAQVMCDRESCGDAGITFVKVAPEAGTRVSRGTLTHVEVRSDYLDRLDAGRLTHYQADRIDPGRAAVYR